MPCSLWPGGCDNEMQVMKFCVADFTELTESAQVSGFLANY